MGGFLADKYLGRYRTILFLSLFYCLGHGSLALFEGKLPGVYLGLALIALGAGGIKPCVSAFVADQFTSLDERGLAKVYGIFYWAVNVGAAMAFVIIPAVAPEWKDGKMIAQNGGYSWAFAIPGIFMAIAAAVFWLGTPLYIKRNLKSKAINSLIRKSAVKIERRCCELSWPFRRLSFSGRFSIRRTPRGSNRGM